MKRFLAIAVYLLALGGLAYYVWTHSNIDRMRRLKQEQKRLQTQNDELARRNDQLRRRIEALRQGTRLGERLARQQRGLARPNELVFQFEDDERADSMRVQVRVDPETIQLAGRSVSLDDLEGAVADLREQWPNMELQVECTEDVGVLRRSRVRALLDQ